jgi:hypothetical protein
MKDNSMPVIAGLVLAIVFVLAILVLTIGIFNYNWFDFFSKNSYVKYIPEKKSVFTKVDATNDMNKSGAQNGSTLVQKIVINNKNVLINVADDNIQKIENNKATTKFSKHSTVQVKKDASFDNKTEKIYAKGSNLKDQNFHSLGEFVSDEESQYRYSLIRNLRLKTVVINSITKGNGVSQEYFKVAYQNNMIPAKILIQLVESKEFRNLIPKKYLTREFEMSGFKNGESVEFKNIEIKNLLEEWCAGRLTPVQKAWSTKAEK